MKAKATVSLTISKMMMGVLLILRLVMNLALNVLLTSKPLFPTAFFAYVRGEKSMSEGQVELEHRTPRVILEHPGAHHGWKG